MRPPLPEPHMPPTLGAVECMAWRGLSAGHAAAFTSPEQSSSKSAEDRSLTFSGNVHCPNSTAISPCTLAIQGDSKIVLQRAASVL